MHGNLPRLPEYGGRGVEVARLVRIGHENVVPEHAVRPREIPAARTPGPGETPENDASWTTSRPVRVRHAAQWPCIKPGRLRPAIGTWAPGKTASAEHCCVVG